MGATAVIGWLAIGTVAWGALAFGTVYPWAYWPLVAAAAVTGVAGLCQRPAIAAPKALLLTIGCVALGMALQLVPLPRPVLSSLSPPTDTLLQTYNLPYAAAVTTSDAPERWARHALSLRPEATGRRLALLTAFTLLVAGLSRALHSGGLRRLGYRISAVGLLLRGSAALRDGPQRLRAAPRRRGACSSGSARRPQAASP